VIDKELLQVHLLEEIQLSGMTIALCIKGDIHKLLSSLADPPTEKLKELLGLI